MYLIILSIKQGVKYHFLSLRYDSTWDWTPVSRAIGEHCSHKGIDYYLFISFQLWFDIESVKHKGDILVQCIRSEIFGFTKLGSQSPNQLEINFTSITWQNIAFIIVFF